MLRFPDDATQCPGCGSTRIRLLDVLPIPRDMKGRRTLFLSGCNECGLLFANPVPTSEQPERYLARRLHRSVRRSKRCADITARAALRGAAARPAARGARGREGDPEREIPNDGRVGGA